MLRRSVSFVLLAVGLLTACGEPFLSNIPLATTTPLVATRAIDQLAKKVPTPSQPAASTVTPTPEPSATPTAPADPTATVAVKPTPTTTVVFVSKLATPLTSAETTICFKNGELITTTFFSPLQDAERNVRVYLPPCYGEDGYRYPVLYMLHGFPQSDATWDEVLQLDESAETLIKQGIIPPLIIIMPDGRPWSQTTSGGPRSLEAVIIDELMPFVADNWCISAKRRHHAIGGVSRGAYWATEIAFRHAAQFGSVGAHSAAFLDTGDNPEINPLYTALRNDLDGLRIYFDYGRDDTLVNTALDLHRQMETADIAHEWIIHTDGGHDEDYWRSQTATYLRWYAAAWSLDRVTYDICQP